MECIVAHELIAHKILLTIILAAVSAIAQRWTN